MAFYVKVKGPMQTVFVTCNPTDTVATVKKNFEKMTEEAPKQLLNDAKEPVADDKTLAALEAELGHTFYLE